MKKILNQTSFVLFVCLFFPCLYFAASPNAFGADYYVSPTGSNSNPGTYNAPWQTITYTTSQMAGGDTLILKDGTYYNSSRENMISPPSGSPANYTIIKAENDWQAVIDGQGFQEYSNWPVNITTASYIQIEGLKIKNGSSDAAIYIAGSNHIKVLRTSIRNGVAHDSRYGNPVSISKGSHHVLIEDVWVTGAMRYGVIVSGDENGETSKVILRRVVVRWDYIDSNEPKFNISIYGNNDVVEDLVPVTDVLVQNCIAIDLNPGTSYNLQSGGMGVIKSVRNIDFYGCIVLNQHASGTYSQGMGISIKGYKAIGNGVYNSVVWDINSSGIREHSSDRDASITIDQVTVGNAQRGVSAGDGSLVTTTVKNSVFLNNTNPNQGIDINAYNSFLPYSQAQGTNATEALLPKYIVRSKDTGTGEGGVKRGATIEKRYGVSGTLWGETGYDQLTNESLWPWPYEAQIKADFSESNDPPAGAYPTTNDTTRGFCAAGQTLTNYIWGYLGNTVPPFNLRIISKK